MLIHSYDNLTAGAWLRGNLHTHTTNSDGERPPQAVIDDYAARGYGFLALSDHDIFTGEADYAKLNGRGMVLVPGNEITANGPHILHVNPTRRVEPVADRVALLADAQTAGGFTVVNHPNWEYRFNHCTIDQLRAWTGYVGVEIYNGVIQRLEGSPYSLDKWDLMLSAGASNGAAPGRKLWGFAHDDSHAAVGDVELGWNVAYVKERTVAGVMDALVNGRFYASTGVTITSIKVSGNRISIHTADASRICVHTRFGRRVTHVDSRSIEFEVPAGLQYVRFTCWGDGEKFAWTQPFWNV